MPHRIQTDSKAAVQKRRRQAIVLRRAERSLAHQEAAAAVSLLDEVLHEDADHVGALELLARAYWQLQSHPHVLQTTKRLILLNPFEPGYHGLKGMALRAMGHYGEAARSLSRDPQAAEALRELEGFQAGLIRDLLASDPVFAAQYTKDPLNALSEKGFYFQRNEAAVAWVAENRPTSSHLIRPS